MTQTVDPDAAGTDAERLFMVQLTPSGTLDFRGRLKSLVYPAMVA